MKQMRKMTSMCSLKSVKYAMYLLRVCEYNPHVNTHISKNYSLLRLLNQLYIKPEL